MKKIKFYVFALLATVFISSCSNDSDIDEPVIVNPESMRIKSVADLNMSYDGNILSEIKTTEGINAKFSYSKTKSTSSYSTMTITYDDDIYDIRYFKFELNEKGFVKKCIQTYENSEDVDTWEFEYNSNDQLSKMFRSEGGNEITEIKYENGNIIEVNMKSDDEDSHLQTKVYYTSESELIPLSNINDIMMFDVTFGIDLDEMEYAYWAGLLGKPTKNLPVKTVYYDEGQETETYKWDIQNNYIKSLIQKSPSQTETYNFTWEQTK